MTQETIVFTQERLKAFKKEYAKHKDDPAAVFVFGGREFLVSYAGYLIEHLESNWK